MKASILVISLFLLVGCKQKQEESKKDFDSNKWLQGEVVILKLKTEKAIQHQKLVLRISHVEGTQMPGLPIHIIKRTSNGGLATKEVNLVFIDSSGKSLSDCSGDYCDFKSIIDEDFSMDAHSEDSFEISNAVKLPYIPGIMQMSVALE